MSERITQAELARRLGVSRAAVSKAAKRGRIHVGEDRRVDAEQAMADWDDNRGDGGGHNDVASPQAKPNAPAVKDADRLRTARAIKAMHDANIQRMKAERMQGNLVSRLEVQEAWGQLLSSFREQLRVVGTRVAERLAAETDSKACRSIVDREIETALNSLPDEAPTRR